jgi:hypothetical protein
MFDISVDIFDNWNKEIYISNKKGVKVDDYNNEIVEYDEPFYFGEVNYQPLTGKSLEAYIQTYGETQNDIVCCFIDIAYDGKIKPLDLAYLYGATPDGEAVYGDNANYIVRTYRKQNTRIMVVFEEMIKEENDGNS